MAGAASARLARLLDVVRPLRDVLEQRVERPVAPPWCEARNWTTFLLELDDATLHRAEAHGLGSVIESLDAPEALRRLARDLEQLTSLPALVGASEVELRDVRGVRLRKRGQLARMLAAVSPMAARAERIVDVGAGSGHLTRLSAELFGRSALGLERDPARVAAARRQAVPSGVAAEFIEADARQGLQLEPGDFAIGLHACGELADRLVEQVADAGCDLTLVSCCLQKISGEHRAALTRLAADLPLRREHLGLTNLTAQPQGVETSIEATLSARQTRYALARLLEARGVELEPGSEMRGINRRQANRGLRAVASSALAQRGLPAVSDAELARHELDAARDFAVMRRLSLPRNLLARSLEILVALDRAGHLEQRGLEVRLAALFDRSLSPRNIGLFASRDSARLPVTL